MICVACPHQVSPLKPTFLHLVLRDWKAVRHALPGLEATTAYYGEGHTAGNGGQPLIAENDPSLTSREKRRP